MECRYGSDFMTYEDWKNGIDYLSEMKINKIVCGLYGCWGRQYDGDFAEYDKETMELIILFSKLKKEQKETILNLLRSFAQ